MEYIVRTNSFQSQETRRKKYNELRKLGVSVSQAVRVRDWRNYYFNQYKELLKNSSMGISIREKMN